MPAFIGTSHAAADSLSWNGTNVSSTNSYLSDNWFDENYDDYATPAAGDNLSVNNGATITFSLGQNSSMVLSSSSGDGEAFNIDNGAFETLQTGGAGEGYGLLLDQGGNFTNSGGVANFAGPVSVGQDANNTASLTFSGGQTYISTGLGTDPNFYVGNSGNGTVTQSSGYVTAPDLQIGAQSGASGTYNMSGGQLVITNLTDIGQNGAAGVFNISGGSVKITSTLNIENSTATVNVSSSGTLSAGTIILTSGVINLSGGVINVGSISLAVPGDLNWTAGTLNLTNSSLTVGSGGELGSSLSVGSSQNLDITGSGQSLTITGSMTVSGGGLSASTINQSSGRLTDTGTLLLASTGGNAVTYDLSGGVLSTGSLSVASGGTFSWTKGALFLSNSSLTIGSGGPLGSNLALGSGQDLYVAGSGQTLYVGGTMSVGGGGLATAAAIINEGGVIIVNGTGSEVGCGSVGVTDGATLNVTGGAAVSGGTVQIGNGAASVNIIGVGTTGVGSMLYASSDLTVGVNESETDTLSLSNGGEATSGAGGISISGDGTINLGTAGQTDTGGTGLFSVGSIYVGGNQSGEYGIGVVNVHAGTEIDTDGTLKIWNSAGSSVNLAGGFIEATTLDTTNGSNNLVWTAGTLVIIGSIINTPSITVPSSGKLIFEPNATAVTTLNSLSISPGGIVDLNNNHIFINYGSGPDPISSIAAWIASGYAGGNWNGAGIMSTIAQSNSASYGIGYADSADPGNPADLPSGTIEIMYTLLGDANLDGKVNGTDFTLMAANFNDSVTNGWDKGDFNYSNSVNGNDFVLLADNFNDFASQSSVASADLEALDSFAAANGISLTSIPEPTCTALVITALFGVMARRLRK